MTATCVSASILLPRFEDGGPVRTRLRVPLHRNAALAEPLRDAIEEHVAAQLADVEHADGDPIERDGLGRLLARHDLMLAGRVEQRCLVMVSSSLPWS